MLRHVPPAGAPIGLSDLGAWASSLVLGPDPLDRLRSSVRTRFKVNHCALASTGRAGMVLLLRALARLSGSTRPRVIVPSYTCYSVPASVAKAGLRARLVDIDPRTLDFDFQELETACSPDVLAIVATNLFGYPNDMARLDALARERGVFLIDDAAQAMGATSAGRLSGTWGHAGLYSLDKGKNVTALEGGVLVADSREIAAAIESEVRRLPSPGRPSLAFAGFKLLVYAAFLRPSLYWIPNSIPPLGLGTTVYATDYPLHQYNGLLAALADRMLMRLEEFTQIRRRHASQLMEEFRHIKGLSMIQPTPSASPVYLRLPIVVDDPATRERLVRELNKAGIGATKSYPRSLADLEPLSHVSCAGVVQATGGRYVADRIVTLPTHPLVSPADLQRMVRVTRNVLGQKASSTCAA